MKRSGFFILVLLLIFFVSSCGSEDPVAETDGNNMNNSSDSDSGGNILPDNSDIQDENESIDDEVPDTDPTDPWNDQDDDGDGVPNGTEGKGDTDEDGTPDYLDTDSDNDGIPDSDETPNGVPVDTDEDGTPDFQDSDSDGDGIPDSIEGTADFDGDNIPNYRDTDNDNDGINDAIECPTQPCVDGDSDGQADYLDTDSDDDGIPDLYEGIEDTDKDGTPNFLDNDSDGDGILDYDENEENIPPLDSDEDGKANYIDNDSDNDGLSDKQEVEFGSDPTMKDSDGDETDDFTEYIFGSDPKDPNSNIPEDAFYLVLPYGSDPQLKTLDFSTDIKKVDILILVDLSGSMTEEHAKLKTGIKDIIIDGVRAVIPDSAFGLVKFGTVEDKVYEMIPVTLDEVAVKTAIDGISDCGGVEEYHTEVLYQAATGSGTSQDICFNEGLFNICTSSDSFSIGAQSCSGQIGNIGGGCFRDEAFPIFIMATDENFQSDNWDDWDKGNETTITEAINAMNIINAKFIGINTVGDSRDPQADFDNMSTGTGSVNSLGENFNQKLTSDGDGFSQKIVDAIVELTNNIQINITTKAKHIDNVYGVADTTQFISSVTPNNFPDVKPGQNVTFEVTFENDVIDNDGYETMIFIANINVLGDGSFLDSRDVFIVVPGKDYTGPEN